MRLSTAAAVVLAACLGPASAFSVLGRDQSVLATTNQKVPGQSPLEFCEGTKPDSDVIHIESVDLDPNPPKAGTELLITAIGTVKETIEEGAYIRLTIKYGLITIIKTTADLCEQIKNVDLDCPVKPGILTIKKTAELPAEIPPGKYHVVADVFNADDTPITCITAIVEFKRGGSFLGLDL